MADATTHDMPTAPQWERIPRAEGSLLRAWAAVARPMREQGAHHAFAAWAATMTPTRIAWTLLIAGVIDLCSGLIGECYDVIHGRVSLHAPDAYNLVMIATGPIFHLAEFVAIALTAAALVSAFGYGSFRRRLGRVLRPWALVQVPIAVAGLWYALLHPILQSSLNDSSLLAELWSSLVWVPSYYVVLYLAPIALAVGGYRFTRDWVVTLVAFLTWAPIYVGYFALTGWIQHALRIGGS